jgi:hypothetical protein
MWPLASSLTSWVTDGEPSGSPFDFLCFSVGWCEGAYMAVQKVLTYSWLCLDKGAADDDAKGVNGS